MIIFKSQAQKYLFCYKKCRKTKHKIKRNLQINIEKKEYLVYSKFSLRDLRGRKEK